MVAYAVRIRGDVEPPADIVDKLCGAWQPEGRRRRRVARLRQLPNLVERFLVSFHLQSAPRTQ